MHWLLCWSAMYTHGLDQQGRQGEGSSTWDKESRGLLCAGRAQKWCEGISDHELYNEVWWGKAVTEMITEVKHHILKKAFPKLPGKLQIPIFTLTLPRLCQSTRHHCDQLRNLLVDYSFKICLSEGTHKCHKGKTVPVQFTTVPSAPSTVTGWHIVHSH